MQEPDDLLIKEALAAPVNRGPALVCSAMNVCAGEGVARALYYHRTGEVLDRTSLKRLKIIKEDSTLERGTAAEALLDNLR